MTGKEVKRGQSLTKASVAPRPPTASRGGRQLSDWVAEFTGMRMDILHLADVPFVELGRPVFGSLVGEAAIAEKFVNLVSLLRESVEERERGF